MKKSWLLLFTVIRMLQLYAQDDRMMIVGRVIDSTTQQPLSGASAFCPNTSFGAVCNNDGWFKFHVPPGGYDLVISYTGYERKVMRIHPMEGRTDTLWMILSPEQRSLETVAVIASNEVQDGWTQYGQLFMDQFVGTSPNAQLCKLMNPETLRFFFSKKRNRLKVTARETLQLRNEALGYDIKYQLDSFSIDYTNKFSQYAGYAFFKSIDTSEDVRKIYRINRIRTYLGSRLHFMRALYDSTVKEEGFLVEKLEGDLKSGKPLPIENLYDSSLYEADSMDVTIGWNGYYRIHYTLRRPDSSFLEKLQLPKDTKFQTSIVFANDAFVIETNGYFYDEFDLINEGGYWTWCKIADLLPYDYDPD